MNETVILVDEQDRQIGVEEKLQAHREGKLHRAFSIFVFNGKGEMLLQKRALHKYHSAGLWTNTCCSHPRPHESIAKAATRRLQEEMGFACKLQKAFDFIYRVEFDNGLIEHELDHVFIGHYDGGIAPNPGEVADYQWANIDALQREAKAFPEKYTTWFKIALERALQFAAMNRQFNCVFFSGPAMVAGLRKL